MRILCRVPLIKLVMCKGCSWVINVELGVDRSNSFRWQKRASPMYEFTMKPINPRTTTSLIERLIHLSPYRSHGQSTVVIANMSAKGPYRLILKGKKLKELIRRMKKIIKSDFATKTAFAKLRMPCRRVCKVLRHPMKSMTKGALHIHVTQIMNMPVRIKGVAC